jgi:Mn2+/Fe2+ NRAMP family transporter
MCLAYNTFVPRVTLQRDYILAIVAVLGTTITPYCGAPPLCVTA